MKVSPQSLSNPKIIYPALFILLIVSAYLYTLEEGERTLRINTQKQLTKTTQVKERIEKELDSGKEKICLLEKQLEESGKQMQLALDKIEIEIAARTKAEQKLMMVRRGKGVSGERSNKFNFASQPQPVELEKIVIKQISNEVAGKVIKVDKKYAFVVLDLGRKDNLRVVDILSVYRNDKFIGKVRVERLEDDRSAAVILPQWQDTQFKEGDKVKKV